MLLWEAFRQGNKESFGSLFQTYYPLLFQFGSKMTSNTALLEDCIQELFVELWQSKLPAPAYSVKAYLVKSLKYKILKLLRKDSSLSSVQNADDISFELSHEHFLIAKQEDLEKSARIKTAITHLSNRQKEIIYLKYYQNLSYEEVSDIMNINYQTARNLLYQSIRSLKKILTNESLLIFILLFVFSISAEILVNY